MKQQQQAIEFDFNVLSEGAVAETIARELKKIAENLVDPNVKNSTRKLNVAVGFKLTDDAKAVSVSAQVKSTLAPDEDKVDTFLIGRNGMGDVEMRPLRSSAPGQLMIDPESGQMLDDDGEPLPASTGKIEYIKK
ncbi:hypothetical protein [Weissella cibaria]|uniref:hypothetical protein n=1 Tax=Weissella cibaria TaxID=137591 RepID=UPI001C1F738F|nr:hypothetical protein [Weissella cibaria]MBU7544313.1 hypothetical protein [Weissella cibaria]MCV3317403.1 hypothetical protein [Weissella cibaria]